MNLIKNNKNENVEEYFRRIKKEKYKPKVKYQEISKKQIEKFLKHIGRFTDSNRDSIYCLINNELPSLFSNKSNNLTISSGASTAMIGAYIGILLRGKKKIDRETIRDDCMKPLMEVGIVEPVTFQKNFFVLGHDTKNSKFSSYRINSNFLEMLKKVDDADFEELFQYWISSSKERKGLIITYEKNRLRDKKYSHPNLVDNSVDLYAKHFLTDYKCIFKDKNTKAKKISSEESDIFERLSIVFGRPEDVRPDVILYNEKENSLWFIEAVTSDGEVDYHKYEGYRRICEDSKKKFGGCTTTYYSLKRFFERQNLKDNLVAGSYYWIVEHPEKQYLISAKK